MNETLPSTETISFFNVVLRCGAAPAIGCGSKAKPVLVELENSSLVNEAWLNRQGTVIAIVWNGLPCIETIARPIFQKYNIEFAALNKEISIPFAKTFRENNQWYRGLAVDILSKEEATIIAHSSVQKALADNKLTENEAANIKADIETYFTGELVKIRTEEQLNYDSKHTFKEMLLRIAEKYLGKERAKKVISFDAIDGIINSTQKHEGTNSMKDAIILDSTITCPVCGHQKEEKMPTDACQYFYECENCHTRLKPVEGDCCVFCSYGTAKCPPVQMNASCCSS